MSLNEAYTEADHRRLLEKSYRALLKEKDRLIGEMGREKFERIIASAEEGLGYGTKGDQE